MIKKLLLLIIIVCLCISGCGKVAKEIETETEYVDRIVYKDPTPNAVYSDDGFRVDYKYPSGNVALKTIVYANLTNEEIVLFVENESLVTDIKIKTKDASKYFSVVDDNNTTYNVFCKTGVDSEHAIYLNRSNAQLEKVTGNYIEIYVNDVLQERHEMTDYELSL